MLLDIYLNSNIKFLKSALPLLQGWALSCLLTNCGGLEDDTWVGSHGLEGGSLETAAGKAGSCHSLWNVLCTYPQVCPGRGEPGQSLELSQFHQSGEQTKDKGLNSLSTRTTWQPGTSRELSPTALLSSQTCRSECWGGKRKEIKSHHTSGNFNNTLKSYPVQTNSPALSL